MIVSEEIADYFEDRYLYAGLTYTGHTLACAAALATIEVYEEDALIENSANLGIFLGEALEDIKERHPSVGDVRYIGLFSTIELVENRDTKVPFPAQVMVDVKKTLLDSGLFTFVMVKDMERWYLLLHLSVSPKNKLLKDLLWLRMHWRLPIER